MKSTTCLHLKSPLRKRGVQRAKLKFKNYFPWNLIRKVKLNKGFFLTFLIFEIWLIKRYTFHGEKKSFYAWITSRAWECRNEQLMNSGGKKSLKVKDTGGQFSHLYHQTKTLRSFQSISDSRNGSLSIRLLSDQDKELKGFHCWYYILRGQSAVFNIHHKYYIAK